MPYFFPKKSIATIIHSQLLLDVLALGLFRLLDGDAEMSSCLLLGLSPVVIKGYHLGQVGGNDGHAGVQKE